MPPRPANSVPAPSNSPTANRASDVYVSVDSQTPSLIDFQADALFAHVPVATDSHTDAPVLVPSSLPAAADAPAPVPSLLPTHATPLHHRDTEALLPSETTPLIPPPTQKVRWRRRLAMAPELIFLLLSVLFSFAFGIVFLGTTVTFILVFVYTTPWTIWYWEHAWDVIRAESVIVAVGAVVHAVLVTTLVPVGLAGILLLIFMSAIVILDALNYAFVGAPQIARTRWQQMARTE